MHSTPRSSPAFAVGGVEGEFACICCGRETAGYHFLKVRSVCPEHCSDHDFEYDRDRRGHFCLHCDEEREWEPDEDDVGFSFVDRDPDRQIGTPISQLSGRPGEPGFGRFCEIARSWGYD